MLHSSFSFEAEFESILGFYGWDSYACIRFDPYSENPDATDCHERTHLAIASMTAYGILQRFLFQAKKLKGLPSGQSEVYSKTLFETIEQSEVAHEAIAYCRMYSFIAARQGDSTAENVFLHRPKKYIVAARKLQDYLRDMENSQLSPVTDVVAFAMTEIVFNLSIKPLADLVAEGDIRECLSWLRDPLRSPSERLERLYELVPSDLIPELIPHICKYLSSHGFATSPADISKDAEYVWKDFKRNDAVRRAVFTWVAAKTERRVLPFHVDTLSLQKDVTLFMYSIVQFHKRKGWPATAIIIEDPLTHTLESVGRTVLETEHQHISPTVKAGSTIQGTVVTLSELRSFFEDSKEWIPYVVLCKYNELQISRKFAGVKNEYVLAIHAVRWIDDGFDTSRISSIVPLSAVISSDLTQIIQSEVTIISVPEVHFSSRRRHLLQKFRLSEERVFVICDSSRFSHIQSLINSDLDARGSLFVYVDRLMNQFFMAWSVY